MSLNQSDKNFFKWLALHTKQPESLTIQSVREAIKILEPFVDSPADIPFEDQIFACRDGHQVRLRFYKINNEIKPLIIFFPGNAFIYDLFEANHSVISKIAKIAGCHAVMVDYRLAPEYPYPAALNDAIEAVLFIFEKLDSFRADPKKIVLAGYSSGANLAAVVTNKLRKHSILSIFHQFLISGGYDYTNSLHEYDEYGLQDKILGPEEAQYSFDAYCKESERKDPDCSPYWEPDLTGLPPTTIMVAEYDGGRSQSEGYAKRLSEAGNQVTKIVLPGQTHGTILYRKAFSDGEDPAKVAGIQLRKMLS